jgi:hypothetical protein
MSGDDLAISALLLSSGLAIVLTIVSILGWKHKLFLGVMWMLGVVLIIGGLLWHWIKAISPAAVTTPVVMIGSNPLSYTVLALVLAIMLVVFRKSDAQLGTRHDRHVWASPYKALATLTDQSLQDANNVESESFHKAFVQQSVTEKRLAEAVARDNSSEEIELRSRLQDERAAKALAEYQSEAARANLVDDLYSRLRSGQLIARGLPHPIAIDSKNRKQVIIPLIEWKFLQIDFGEEKAEGQGIAYIALEIRKR